VHTTLPVYLQNLPFILNKTVHTFSTWIHDNIHTHRAKHVFAKRWIRHDIPLLINNTTFNFKKQNYNVQFTRIYYLRKRRCSTYVYIYIYIKQDQKKETTLVAH
jgi:hypothetical protein